MGLDLALAPWTGSSDQQGSFRQVVSRDQTLPREYLGHALLLLVVPLVLVLLLLV